MDDPILTLILETEWNKELHHNTLEYSFQISDDDEILDDICKIKDTNGYKSLVSKKVFSPGEEIVSLGYFTSFESNIKNISVAIATWTRLIYLQKSVRKRMEHLYPRHDIYKDPTFQIDIHHNEFCYDFFQKTGFLKTTDQVTKKIFVQTFCKITYNLNSCKSNREGFTKLFIFNKLGSSINYSCGANAQLTKSTRPERRILTTFNMINIGDEICVTPMVESAVCDNYEQRRKRISEQYHFICKCPHCIAGEKDKKDGCVSYIMWLLFSMNQTCAWCGINVKTLNGKSQKCSQCHKVYYCGKECQKIHWNMIHKRLCKELAERKT